MYLLKHLAKQNAITVEVEYRLVCSGCLTPANIAGDPTRSDVARILLREPFTLLVASRPYDRYPQELVMRFSTEYITEPDGPYSHSFFPHAEIARDVAALLSLYCRRLVTVFGNVRERYSDPHLPPALGDWPTEIASLPPAASWAVRPASVVYGIRGDKVTEYQPPTVEFDAPTFSRLLNFLPQWDLSAELIRAARLYTLALELIETRFSVAYLLLVSAAETVAGAALKDDSPDEAVKKKRFSRVRDAAIKVGCSEDAADQVMLAAAEGERWATWKFVKFLMGNVDTAELARQDEVMMTPPELCPAASEVEPALKHIYRARSGASHAGKEWPIAAQVGPNMNVPLRAFADVMNEKAGFPPIGWFERVVQSAIMRFVLASVKNIES